MYCTVCLFLQSKLSGIRNEKQSEGTLLHLPDRPTGEDRKKERKTPSKGNPKLIHGAFGSTPKEPLKPITIKNHFLRWSLIGGFEVFLTWDLEMGRQLYIDVLQN